MTTTAGIREYGLTLVTVSRTDDPQGMGRIKVLFPLSGEQQDESDWIAVASPYAGSGIGAFFLPKAGDQALVGYVDADPNQPYVLGFLWNGRLKPPVETARQQDVRTIRTGGGKEIRLDDSADGGITITDANNNRVAIKTSDGAITIEGKGAMTIRSAGNMTIEATGTLTIKAARVEVETTGGSKLSLSGGVSELTSSGAVRLSGTTITLN